jgi:DNA-binding XRE family transcriptional regulator
MRTNLQIINNTQGKSEYVLLPIVVYDALKDKIEQKLKHFDVASNYVDFKPEDFIKNRIALVRMRAKITQTVLAKELNTSQAYISKIENDDYKVTEKLFNKINAIIKKLNKKNK